MMRIRLFVLTITGFALNVFSGDLSKNITFKLTFENGLIPEIAKGNPTPKFLGHKKLLKFGKGLGKGRALITGIGKQAVRFKSSGNIDSKKGSVTFWVKGYPGVRWNWRDRKFYHFFQWINKDNIRIYKYSINDFTRFYERKKIHFYPMYKEDDWNFFVFTWNGPDLKWYLNGELVGNVVREKPFPPVSRHSYFDIGQYRGKDSQENRVTDELIIYNRSLTRTEILSLYAAGTGMPTKQIIRLSATSKKIEIDGKMSPTEWQDASTMLIGLDTKTKSVARTISRLYLTYDKQYLYFYLKSPIPTRFFDDAQNTLLHGFFNRRARQADHIMDFDDALEFRFKTARKKFWYRMMVNTIDVKYDKRFTGTRQELKWNPRWITKTRVSDDGWDLEGKIPFSDFSGPPPADSIWQMNVYRIWKKLKTQVDAWSNDNYSPSSQATNTGQLIFGGKSNVAVKVSKLIQLDNRGINMEFILRSNGSKARDVVFEILTGDKQLLERKALNILPNKDFIVNINNTFSAKPPDRVFLRVTDIPGNTIFWLEDVPVFKVEDIVLKLSIFPLKKKLRVSGEFPQLELNLAKTKVSICLRQNKRVIKKLKLRLMTAKFDTELDISKLPQGTYTSEVKLFEKGRIVATEKAQFKIADPPAWLGNKLGITKVPPKPWTPVKYQQDKITVWGRDYIYNNSLFPTQIDAVGDGLLAKPIKVNLKVSGKDILSNAKVTVKKLHSDDMEATFLRTINLKDATVQVKTRIEFDGMMWNSLSIIPRHKYFKIDSLRLDVPLKKRNSTLMMPHDYTLRNTGFTKKWHGSIRPVWIGNEERGLCFFTEHSYNWIIRNRQKELEIIPRKKDTMLRVNLIDHPAIIRQPLKLAFGLMATPVKKMRKDYRKWRIHHFTNQITPEKNAQFIQMPFRKWAKNPFYETCYPVADPNMRPVSGIRNRSKWEGLLYHQLKRTWAESPEAKMFAHEWSSELRVVPTVDSDPNKRQIEICQGSKSFQDFLVNGLAKVQREVNGRGFYFDVANFKKCSNVNHGCGYVVNGKIKPTFNILGARELIKRIYIAIKKIRPDSIIAYHVSGQVCLPVHSFADLLFEGENLQSRLIDNRGYQDILTLDTYRAEHMGHNFGPAVTLLPEFKTPKKWFKNTEFSDPEKIRVHSVDRVWLKRRKAGKETKAEAAYWKELAAHTNYLLGLSLLHDNPFWVACICNMAPVRKHYRILGKFNYADGNNKFIPYWKQRIATVMSPGKAIVSFYVSDKQAVAVVMNMSNKKMDVKLRLDVKKLGLSGKIKAVNLQYKNKVILKNGILTIKNIPAYQYRVVMLK
jgi:Glycoside hydrolase 123, N-terminal domain/Concanavalin A-like lectin/glucanases superfamily